MADEDFREGEPERPRKNKPPRRDEKDDDRPRRRRRDDDVEDRDDLGNSALSAVVPIGGSIWALLSLYLSLLSCVIPGLPLLSLIFGIVALVTHKQKASYGSITGNIRAVLGILISLVVIVGQGIFLFLWLADVQMFR